MDGLEEHVRRTRESQAREQQRSEENAKREQAEKERSEKQRELSELLLEQTRIKGRKYKVLLGRGRSAPVNYVTIDDFDFHTRDAYVSGIEGGGGGKYIAMYIRLRREGKDELNITRYKEDVWRSKTKPIGFFERFFEGVTIPKSEWIPPQESEMTYLEGWDIQIQSRFIWEIVTYYHNEFKLSHDFGLSGHDFRRLNYEGRPKNGGWFLAPN